MDAFYASVEQKDNEEYRGKPVIVGGSSNRGVVSACSYEARTYGVHSAMPIFMAKKLCPHAIFVPPRMSRYSQVSRQIITILETFSPLIQQISIDEAFLDMSGTTRLFGIPREAGAALKRRVYEESGLIISVGIGSSKFIAKLASDYDKPNGLCRVSPSKEIEFVDTVPLGKFPGIGKILLQQLNSYAINSTKKLREYSLAHLEKLFGNSAGNYLYHVCRGEDPGLYQMESKSRSISNETTFPEDTSDIHTLKSYLLALSHQVMFRVIEEKVHSNTIAIKLRFSDLSYISGQTTQRSPFVSAEEIYHSSLLLLQEKWDQISPIRLIGIGLHNIQEGENSEQGELFEDSHYRRKRAVEKVVSSLRGEGKSIDKATNLELTNKH
jgi:DNA polymerase-4